MVLLKMKGKILKIVFLFLLFPSPCLAAAPLDVVINEICWMGNKTSANNEWIELYNNTKSPINLEGWKLIAKDKTPKIHLTGEIKGLSFFLLERTDDDSVPEILADLIYKGALSNKGECLELIDNEGKIIDKIDCSNGWFAGNKKTKKTMERINSKLAGSDPNNWQTSQNPGGTPRAQNSKKIKTNPPQNENTKVTAVRPLSISYPKGIVINEILPSPEGSDAKNEYIEIFNQNNIVVDLSGWTLKDLKGKTKTFIFPERTKIGPKEFLVFFRPQTKITLNNSGDGLKLFNPKGELVDEISFEKAKKGKSFNRTKEGWFWSSNLTPGAKNIVPKENLTFELKEERLKTNEKAKAKKERLLEALPAALIKEPLEKETPKNFLFLLTIALFVSLASGISILLLKRKLKPS